jgi:hypothetical protein
MLGCCDERVEKTSLPGRTRGQPSVIGDVLPSPSHHYPGLPHGLTARTPTS